jgi:hypothetical protein
MTGTTVRIPLDTVTDAPDPGLTLIGELVDTTHDLLREAAALAQPRYVTVSETSLIGLQLHPDPSSFASVAQWADQFGGVITSTPTQDSDGATATLCQARFTYMGADVTVYAFIRAETPATL